MIFHYGNHVSLHHLFSGDSECNFVPIVADPSDCRYYYQCVNRRLYHFFCGSAAVFDPSLGSCVSPNNVEGCLGITTKQQNKDDQLGEYILST